MGNKMTQDEVVALAKKAASTGWEVRAGLGGALLVNKQERIASTSDDIDNEIVKTILVMDTNRKVEVTVNCSMYFDTDKDFDLMMNQIKRAAVGAKEVDFVFDRKNMTIEYAIMSFLDPDTTVGGCVVLAEDEADYLMTVLRKAVDTNILRGSY